MKSKKQLAKENNSPAEIAAHYGLTEAALAKESETQIAKNGKSLAEIIAENGMTEEAIVKGVEAVGFKNVRVAALVNQQLKRMLEAWTRPVVGNETVYASLLEMKPENATQAMLAVQMVGTHHAFVTSMCRATDGPKSPAHPDIELTRATRLGRLFIEQMDAMARLKGKNRQQKMTVEHIHVNKGGQAIVGTVSTAGQDRVEGESHASGKKTP